MNVEEKKYKDFQISIQCLTIDLENTYVDYSDHLRFLFIEKGSGIISLNNKKYSFLAPCAISINPTEVFQVEGENQYRTRCLFIKPSIINDSFDSKNIYGTNVYFSSSELLDLYWLKAFLYRSDSYSGVILFGPSTSQRILELWNKLDREIKLQTDSFWPCRTRSYFFELLNLLNALIENPMQLEILSDEAYLSQINMIIQYLNENYQHKITISDLTKFFGINRTTLSEQFIKSTGMSIITYLNKIRIKISCLLLKDTTLPIIEIMERVGFVDTTHFGRIFKKETGFSPSTYREKSNPLTIL